MKNRQDITYTLSDNIKFLITCCQTEPSEDDITFISSYLNTEVLTLSTLIKLSHQHGILPLVYKTLKKLSKKNASPRSLILSKCSQHSTVEYFLAELKPEYLHIAQRNMFMSAELIRIMTLLKDNGIEALAFKGPTLSQMAYGDITLRQYVDLDVLTKKEDIYKIDTLLKEHGYERLLALTPIQEKIWIKYAHDMGLIHKQKGVHFEMHWSFLDEDYPMQVNLEDFWKETQDVTLNGHTIPTFSNENLLYYLCIHGSKHLWERIEWVKDIDLLVHNHAIDWETIIQKAKGAGFEKMLYLGLSLSTSLFHTPLPKSILEKISSYNRLANIKIFVLESWQTKKSTFSKTYTMLKLFPGIKEQATYLHKIILKPSFNEYWYVSLPKGMYLGYYLVRPYLLMKKYLTKNSIS